MLDIVIRGGEVLDGTGSAAMRADVGIKDGRIAALGRVEEAAKQTIDANGRVVSPGFVDVHTHYDAQVFWDGRLSPSCYHGVTTIFGGHCGFSIAPLSKDAAPYLLKMLARVEGMPENSLREGVPWNWQSFGEYLSRLDGKVGVNAGFMAGHCAIRRVVMGKRAVGEKATADDLEKMKKLLGESLAQGAMGFSSTISPTHNDADGNPVPSRHASREELIALARVCRDYEGTSLEFLPAVGRFSDDIKQLMSDLSTAAQRPLNWNAINAGDAATMANQLSASDFARKNGGDVRALTIPQPITLRINLFSGFVFDALAGWDGLFRMSVEDRIEALRDPAKRKALDQSARASGPLRGLADWARLTVHSVADAKHKALEGKSIGAIAQAQGKSPIDAMLDLAIAEGLRTSFMPPMVGADPALWQVRGELWADDRTVIGASDAGAHLDMIDTFAFSTQVLGNGVREHRAMALPAAVHQLTQVPAELFGLRERGVLKPGWFADVVVFDPKTVGSGPVHMRPDLPCNEPRIYADARGVDHVLVNGVQIVANGKHTGALPGKALRSGRDTYTPKMAKAS